VPRPPQSRDRDRHSARATEIREGHHAGANGPYHLHAGPGQASRLRDAAGREAPAVATTKISTAMSQTPRVNGESGQFAAALSSAIRPALVPARARTPAHRNG
jgi:hypothetical protein